MPRENLYFIALIPPHSISEEVTAFKDDFAQNYNSSRALKNMPHITLKAPFKLEAPEHASLLQWFDSLRPERESFTIELEGFGSFANKDNPVIYVKPVMTFKLEALQKSILKGFEFAYPNIPVSYTERNFRPHMTIAYRDLTREQYTRAIDVYQHKKYSTSFMADRFFLLQHDGMQWSVVAEHILA